MVSLGSKSLKITPTSSSVQLDLSSEGPPLPPPPAPASGGSASRAVQFGDMANSRTALCENKLLALFLKPSGQFQTCWQAGERT